MKPAYIKEYERLFASSPVFFHQQPHVHISKPTKPIHQHIQLPAMRKFGPEGGKSVGVQTETPRQRLIIYREVGVGDGEITDEAIEHRHVPISEPVDTSPEQPEQVAAKVEDFWANQLDVLKHIRPAGMPTRYGDDESIYDEPDEDEGYTYHIDEHEESIEESSVTTYGSEYTDTRRRRPALRYG